MKSMTPTQRQTQLLHQWILNQSHRPSIVEEPELINLLQDINPRFYPLKTPDIEFWIQNTYFKKKQLFKHYLNNLSNPMCITYDLRISSNEKLFIEIRCHYIDDAWTTWNQILDIKKISGIPSGEVISKLIFSTLEEFEIRDKVQGFH
jgi:hypothetical protein